MIAFSRSRQTWMPKLFRKSYKTILAFPRSRQSKNKKSHPKQKKTTSPPRNCSSWNGSSLTISRMWARNWPRMSVSLIYIRSHLSTWGPPRQSLLAPVSPASSFHQSFLPHSQYHRQIVLNGGPLPLLHHRLPNRLQDRSLFSTLNNARAVPRFGDSRRAAQEAKCTKYFKLVFRLLDPNIDRVATWNRQPTINEAVTVSVWNLKRHWRRKCTSARTLDCPLWKIRWTVAFEKKTEANRGTRYFRQNGLETAFPSGAPIIWDARRSPGPMPRPMRKSSVEKMWVGLEKMRASVGTKW